MVVNNLFFINWLIIDFSWWSSVFFGDNLFSVFSRSDDFWMVNSLWVLSINSDSLFDCFLFRLDVFFSNGSSTRDSNWNSSGNSLIINDWSIFDLFSINRSRNFSSSDDWGLNNSLSDDRLRNSLSSNDWLRNNFSLNNWLRNDFLGLSDLWFAVKYLIFVLGKLSRCRLLVGGLWFCLSGQSGSKLCRSTLSLNFCELSTGNQFLQVRVRKLLIRLSLVGVIWWILFHGLFSEQCTADQKDGKEVNFHLSKIKRTEKSIYSNLVFIDKLI